MSVDDDKQEIQEQTEAKYEELRPEVEVKVPDNLTKMVNENMKAYKKWLTKYLELEGLAEHAKDEEEQEEFLQQAKQLFRERYAGVVAKDNEERLSPAKIQNIWNKFMRDEYRGFLKAHVNLKLEDILIVGIDKFIYTLGWRKPSDVVTWHNNRIRIGICCSCQDQFIPMMLQYNHGLCRNCRPQFSHKAIRHFILDVLNTSERYHNADQDLMMDFYIMFYHDPHFRAVFKKDSDTAKKLEEIDVNVPSWLKDKKGIPQEEETDE